MNIDFHYGVVYVLCRLAGMPVPDARTVAHACEYVDDATQGGLLFFEKGETFDRFASAHEMVDYQNADNDKNRAVWAPFHFLPGGEGDTIEQKAICRPDSVVAQAMIQHAIDARAQDNALHRLGVSLHVYVDTFAHQGFSGITSPGNQVRELAADDMDKHGWLAELADRAKHVVDDLGAFALDRILPLGHGAALHYPDMPWVKWHYVDGYGNKVTRDNLAIFLDAAEMSMRAIRGHMAGQRDYLAQPGLSPEQRAALSLLLSTIRDANPDNRLKALSVQLGQGVMPGLHEPLPEYSSKGPNSWKFIATGIASPGDDSKERPVWTSVFEDSDYRKFHDAVKEHRFTVTQQILPDHNVRLA